MGRMARTATPGSVLVSRIRIRPASSSITNIQSNMQPDCPTLENLLALIADKICCGPETIQPTDSFWELGIDSLDHVQLISECEELFEIDIPDGEAAACRSVLDLHAAILRAQDYALPKPLNLAV